MDTFHVTELSNNSDLGNTVDILLIGGGGGGGGGTMDLVVEVLVDL